MNRLVNGHMSHPSIMKNFDFSPFTHWKNSSHWAEKENLKANIPSNVAFFFSVYHFHLHLITDFPILQHSRVFWTGRTAFGSQSQNSSTCGRIRNFRQMLLWGEGCSLYLNVIMNIIVLMGTIVYLQIRCIGVQ